MTKTKPLGCLVAIFTFLAPLEANAQTVAFPLKYSENRRYFVDQEGKPFLYHADTAWLIYSRLTTEEAREYLLFRKNQGFNTVQTQIVMAPEHVNRYGQKAFDGDTDFARPNEAYHDQVARVIDLADSLNLLVVMSQPWLGHGEAFGNGPDKPFRRNGPQKSREYGRYLGKKFARFRNLFWILGGDNDPKGDLPEILALAQGLYETAPKHQLITYHASTTHSSTDLFQHADWLGFSMIYTYGRDIPGDWVNPETMVEVYEAAIREYNKSYIMPFVLGEAQYEHFNDNDIGTPFQVRRQPYWTLLCGGAGHAYGSKAWSFPSNWREIMRYPGAGQLRHFYDFFSQLPWWHLVPDGRHRFVVAGFGNLGKTNYVTTAVTDDGKIAVSYIPERQTIVADLATLKGATFRAQWYDPRTGEYRPLGRLKPSLQQFTPPTNEDWVLLIRGD